MRGWCCIDSHDGYTYVVECFPTSVGSTVYLIILLITQKCCCFIQWCTHKTNVPIKACSTTPVPMFRMVIFTSSHNCGSAYFLVCCWRREDWTWITNKRRGGGKEEVGFTVISAQCLDELRTNPKFQWRTLYGWRWECLCKTVLSW